VDLVIGRTCDEVVVLYTVPDELDPPRVILEQNLVLVGKVLGSRRRGGDPFLMESKCECGAGQSEW
jgi:hypothetical protein